MTQDRLGPADAEGSPPPTAAATNPTTPFPESVTPAPAATPASHWSTPTPGRHVSPLEAPRRSAARSALLLVLGALVTVCVVLAGVALVRGDLAGGDPDAGLTPSDDTAAAPNRTVDPVAARMSALDGLLVERAEALLSRDRERWLGTVDAASTAFATRQAAVFDNLEQVPFNNIRFEFAGNGPSLDEDRSEQVGPEAWVARVVTTYRLAGGDDGDVRRERYLTLVKRDGRWLVADDTDGGASANIWDLGPVNVVRGERTLVLGTARTSMLEQIAALGDEAAAGVDEVWGTHWPRKVVVLVPRDQTEMATLLMRTDETGLDQIAAVTTGEVGGDQSSSADRVIVNPSGFGRLEALGRDVVLTHEFTHVATRATGSAEVPIWLSEGFADYVAYQGTELSRRQVAGDVLDLVAQGEGPTRLATDADFDPATGDIAPAYSSSWLAAEMIARQWSEEDLVELYRAVDGIGVAGASDPAPVPLGEAMSGVLGISLTEFEQRWLAYLSDLSG